MKLPILDFMAKRKVAGAGSIALLLVSVASLTMNGLNFGLDFTGGTLVEVGFPEPVDTEQVRSQLDEAGFVNGVVQHFGFRPRGPSAHAAAGDRGIRPPWATAFCPPFRPRRRTPPCVSPTSSAPWWGRSWRKAPG